MDREASTDLLRSAMRHLDALRETLAQASRAGRDRLDVAALRRDRTQLLERLGEAVLRRAASDPSGLITLTAEMRALVHELQRMEGRIVEIDGRLASGAGEKKEDREPNSRV
jgi:phosphoserine phosphatase